LSWHGREERKQSKARNNPHTTHRGSYHHVNLEVVPFPTEEEEEEEEGNFFFILSGGGSELLAAEQNKSKRKAKPKERKG